MVIWVTGCQMFDALIVSFLVRKLLGLLWKTSHKMFIFCLESNRGINLEHFCEYLYPSYPCICHISFGKVYFYVPCLLWLNLPYLVQENDVTIPTEVYLHRFLDHPNVIKLYDFFEYAQAYVMVLERPLYHKDLFDYITEKRRLNEDDARSIFLQVVEAVMYCESKGIFHRDIKDENILLDTRTGLVKLLDFGSGTVLENTLYTDYEGKKPYKLVGNSLWASFRNLPGSFLALLLQEEKLLKNWWENYIRDRARSSFSN